MKASSSGPLINSGKSPPVNHEYRKKSRFNPNFVRCSGKSETPESGEEDRAKTAFQKAIDYKKKKRDVAGAGGISAASSPSPKASEKQSKEGLSISRIDFVGLNFSDKRPGRGLPPGLVSVPMPEDDFREEEAEIIVGDATKFGNASSPPPLPPPANDDNPSLYKPKVSTWGVFPRPSNISKTYGGGRNITPGESLETKEERAAKDALTRKLLSSYNAKMGLNIDMNLRSQCEQALKDGDALMDVGKLKEALGFYRRVMEKLPFQSELHGMAALQWSICQDSLSRAEEARTMYEKLQSHPNPAVSKKARQFFFGFKAMDMMKVTTSSAANISYQNYFDAFVEGNRTEMRRKTSNGEEEETAESESSYIIVFLVSPLLLLIIIVLLSSSHN